MPRQLDYRLSRNFIRIKSGEVTPQTIIFVSAATNQEYRFKVQMQWGELIEEKTHRAVLLLDDMLAFF